MAFSFSNAVSGGGTFGGTGQTSGAPTVRDGPELKEIQTDQLGFAGVNGEAQLRLLSTPWPSDALPPPTASLLAVASSKGLLAAAGPDELILTSTNSIRESLRSKPKEEGSQIRDFEPQIRLAQSKISHVAFSADEGVLVVSSQETGGLAAYQVAKFGDGQAEPALQLSTDGKPLRALEPNPATDSAELFALVTADGELLMADLRAGNLRSTNDGHILKSGVSCVAWSKQGKALVTGQADGTATQMRPDGTFMATIPKSTSVPNGCHVSAISWLNNDTFFIVYTPSDTSNGIESSEYYIVQREPKTTNFTFRKLPEVVPAFGMERVPTCHFITKLRNFPPHIQDLLILSSTTGLDVGLISQTDAPLSSDIEVTNEFTCTMISNDSRRAALPLGTDSSDTSPVGMVLDLSSDEKVPNPIPSEVDLLETSGPVPNLLILNNEGILLSWWLIYNDSVKQKTLFSGFTDAKTSQDSSAQVQQTPQPEAAKASPFATASSTFGQSSFGTPSTFGKPAATLGSGSTASAFGNSSGSAFGTASSIGGAKSSWTNTGFNSNAGGQASSSGFGQPAFGSATTLGAANTPAFGSASALGGKTNTFGQASMSTTPAFGKPSLGSQTGGFGAATSQASPFGAGTSGSSGFASFSKPGAGFGGFGDGNKASSSSSPFGQATSGGGFGKPSEGFGQSSEGFGKSSENPFGVRKDNFGGFGGANADAGKTPFGSGAFKLDSTFKSDGTASDDLPKPKEPSGFGFGSGFGDMLGSAQEVTSPTHDKEEDMGDGDESSEAEEISRPQQHDQQPQTLITPPSTFGPPKATPAPPVSSLFGTSTNNNNTPQTKDTSTGWSFGQLSSTTPSEGPSKLASTTPQDTPAPAKPLFGTTTFGNTPAEVQKSEPKPLFGSIKQPSSNETPKIKQEPPSDDEAIDVSSVPEAPLPPDTTSKPRYASGDTSASSSHSKVSNLADDAPLPPDFVPANTSAIPETDQRSLPSDESGSLSDLGSQDGEGDEGGSNEDDDLTEVQGEQSEHIQTSPESSFKSGDRSPETSPAGGLFTKVTNTATQKPIRPLFGEVGNTGPILPPPKPQESPRSPSPIRNRTQLDALRTDSTRSVSAPAHPRSVIAQRRAEHAQSNLAAHAAQVREDELARQKSAQSRAAQVKAEEEAKQMQELQDTEDERLRRELDAEPLPTEQLDDFLTYRPNGPDRTAKSGVPAQIEHLYQDINSMIDTLGINARSLSCFMLYQNSQAENSNWPQILDSDTPIDALNDEWVLADIDRLHEGQDLLSSSLKEAQVSDVTSKLQECQEMLTSSLFSLRQKLTSIRRSLQSVHSNADTGRTAPLSAEQASIQHDLRKQSALVSSQLGAVEDGLTLLRARLAESAPQDKQSKPGATLFRQSSTKKPTVEAVMNTVNKMTAMAEKKSFDVDVLEAQLRKLNMLGGNGGREEQHQQRNGTPAGSREAVRTPGSTKSGRSVYHTPDSKFGGSVGSRNGFRDSRRSRTAEMDVGLDNISTEDRERWRAKAKQKKEVADMLRAVLKEKRESELAKA